MPESDDRVQCFLLGARVHDHVGDLLDGIEELDESKQEDSDFEDQLRVLSNLGATVVGEMEEAGEKGCAPSDVRAMWNAVNLGEAVNPEGRTRAREALYALSVRLGDPPGLRNLRRFRSLRKEPAAGAAP